MFCSMKEFNALLFHNSLHADALHLTPSQQENITLAPFGADTMTLQSLN